MALYHELLEQAHHLANREPKNPRQASLRRAASSAYYALFHFLLSEATQLLFPAKPLELRRLASRAFTHDEVKIVCEEWAKGNPILTFVTASTVQLQLKDIAGAFKDLYQLRIDADYNLTKVFDRKTVLSEIAKVKNAINDWKHVKSTENAKIFLCSLLLHKKWSKYNK